MEDFRFSYRAKDNGVQIILSYKDENGKWRQKTKQGFPNKAAAKKQKDALIAAAKASLIKPSGGQLTLTEFYEQVFLPSKESQLALNTVLIYRNAIGAAKVVNGKRLNEITPAMVTEQIARWADEYKRSTASQYVTCLKSVLRSAVFPHEFIAVSPAANVKQPRRQREGKTIRALTADQLDDVLAQLRQRSFVSFVIASIGAFAGLRYGEIAGLRWEDIDLESATLTVQRQVTSRDSNRKQVVSPLKTANSYRCIPLSSRLSETLTAWHRTRQTGFLFPPSVSNYDRYKTNLHHVLPKGYSSRSFRHTFAVRMLQEGADVQTVAALLGDTVETVMNNYLSFTDDLRRAAAGFVEKASK